MFEKKLLQMWTWHHEMLTSLREVVDNGVPFMVHSPHWQQILRVRPLFFRWTLADFINNFISPLCPLSSFFPIEQTG